MALVQRSSSRIKINGRTTLLQEATLVKVENVSQKQILLIGITFYWIICWAKQPIQTASGCIFSRVRPSCKRAVRDLGRFMHIYLQVQVAHSSFIEGSHTTKNTASVLGKSSTLQKYKQNFFQNCELDLRVEKILRIDVFTKIPFFKIPKFQLKRHFG